ncbi:YybH family protein [Bosea sp. NBC_00550]|uniref:YybH family protein n=1 Tax=Bosea sp. NBC_00550 TaxID=2969621 RepID=UPI0022307A87|nr:SgcJ/EcaC family oxidoreductase [Bosea sp. NBC_00550]UZF92826.1 SgcJ/EcaC family oxidoreductase [Bosea sp. NBC_00550]
MKPHAVEPTDVSTSVTRRSATLALAALLPLGTVAVAHGADASVEAAITKQLKSYEQALNVSDLDGVMKLYTEDVVFMPPHAMPVVGREAVRAAYRHIFSAIKLEITFQIDEIRPLSQDWAFARTRSDGTVKVLASNQPASPEANQELFLLRRDDGGQWRIARYIFSTTTPLRRP